VTKWRLNPLARLRERSVVGEQPEGRGIPQSADEGAALVRAAARGERDAQQELLSRYIGRIRARVTRLAGGSSEAQDLVQLACVALLQSLRSYRGDASLPYWVDRVTTHVVLKHFRSTKRRRARIALVDDVSEVDRRDGVDAEDQMQWRQGVEAARAIIDQLKPNRRIVFVLVAVEGRTLAETAGLLDLSLPATKSRYLRARRDLDRLIANTPRLRALLGIEGDTP
jgi:RNA polymerase sigma factor (sigma-70 family)